MSGVKDRSGQNVTRAQEQGLGSHILPTATFPQLWACSLRAGLSSVVHHFLTLQLQSPVIDEAAATEGQILLLAGLRGALPRLLVVYQALPWPGRCSSTLGCTQLGLCSATPLRFPFAPSSCTVLLHSPVISELYVFILKSSIRLSKSYICFQCILLSKRYLDFWKI